jgi:hypothetical protein
MPDRRVKPVHRRPGCSRYPWHLLESCPGTARSYSIPPGRSARGVPTWGALNPGYENEADLANTLAHELSDARDYARGLARSSEGKAQVAGDALEVWIRGLR